MEATTYIEHKNLGRHINRTSFDRETKTCFSPTTLREQMFIIEVWQHAQTWETIVVGLDADSNENKSGWG